jgi:hypothetical protein
MCCLPLINHYLPKAVLNRPTGSSPGKLSVSQKLCGAAGEIFHEQHQSSGLQYAMNEVLPCPFVMKNILIALFYRSPLFINKLDARPTRIFISIPILNGKTQAGILAREATQFTPDQDGKQAREGWDAENRPSRGRRTDPVSANPVCPARRGNIPRTAGHNFTGQVPAGRPDTCHAPGIIEPLRTLAGAEPLFRMDPMSCSARFPDGAGCDRSRADL